MKSMVVTPKNETELKFLSGLLSKLGFKTRTLSAEEMEDSGLVLLMKKADRTKKVSRDLIMKKLQS